ncbi:hypothetical protein B0T21DRAFT_178868 [Apiosordaria backusii]|uniref:Secreted protein n=1 Tax=Apiosordaria backusii TaxID=314023 RepID=A0AA40ECI4_9PEZI|nr:hypothetical protein B0T21DRAFT_178868 [Apiosordaria backusii]
MGKYPMLTRRQSRQGGWLRLLLLLLRCCQHNADPWLMDVTGLGGLPTCWGGVVRQLNPFHSHAQISRVWRWRPASPTVRPPYVCCGCCGIEISSRQSNHG